MRKLSRKNAHRKSLIRNLATSLILYESLETTMAKAKETKVFVDTLLSRVNKGTLKDNRYLHSILFDKNAVKKVLVELLPRYKERTSGFTRIYKTTVKIGDGSQKAIIELIDKKTFVSEVSQTTRNIKKKSEKLNKIDKE